jgi:hypothetical protein
MNGRNPDGYQGALFLPKGNKDNVDSLLNTEDISGFCFYLG